MIHIELRLLPNDDPDPTVHQKLGHIAIEDLTRHRSCARADYVAAIIAPNLDVLEVHRIHDFPPDAGWTNLLARALSRDTTSDDPDAVSTASRAREVIRAALDTRCTLGRPLNELRRVTGDWFNVAAQVLLTRRTQHCDGRLCGGYAHGTVLYRDDYQDALQAVAVELAEAERESRRRQL